MLFLLYIVLKYVAYAGWCYVGLRLLDPQAADRTTRAFGLGFLRLLLGFLLALGIWYVSTRVYGALGESARAVRTLVTYLVVYVPVRWLEWSVLAALIEPPGGTFGSFLFGRDARSRLFRLGGIAASCLADIPMLVDGLPVGRFLC